MLQKLKRLFLLIRPYWWLFVLSTVFSVAASALSGSLAWITKPVTDHVFLKKNYHYLKPFALAVFLLFVARGLFAFLQAYLSRAVALRVVNDLRARIYEKILRVPVGLVQNEDSYRVFSKAVNDVVVVEQYLWDVLKVAVLESVTLVVLLGVALYRSWSLTLLVLSLFPLIAVVSQRLGKKSFRARGLAQERLAELTRAFSEAISGLKEIKMGASLEFFVEQFKKRLFDFYRFSLKLTKYEEGAKLFVSVAAGAGAALILLYGGHLIVTAKITVGEFFSVMTAILMMFSPAKRLSNMYTKLNQIDAILTRVDEVLKLPEERLQGAKVEELKEGIRFEGVSFSYPDGRQALRGVELFIPARSVTVIVGPNGAGKSTLVSLIPRFLDPTEGRVLWDGRDLRELDLSELRRKVSVVFQDLFVFDGTVRENIGFVRPDASAEAIEAAARAAGVEEFVEELSGGYEARVGGNGINLSGGQRQRIAIARALLKDSEVFIFDEATSHLDSAAERYLETYVERLKGKKTVIIITHRPSVIRKADLVVFMKEGRVERLVPSSVDYGKSSELFLT